MDRRQAREKAVPHLEKMPQITDRIPPADRAVAVRHDRSVAADVLFIVDVYIFQPFSAEIRSFRVKGIKPSVTRIPGGHGAVEDLISEVKAACHIFRMADAERIDVVSPYSQDVAEARKDEDQEDSRQDQENPGSSLHADSLFYVIDLCNI